MKRFICLTSKDDVSCYVYLDKNNIRLVVSKLEYGRRYSRIYFKGSDDSYVTVREYAGDIIAELEGAPKPRCANCGEKHYGAEITPVFDEKLGSHLDLCSSCVSFREYQSSNQDATND